MLRDDLNPIDELKQFMVKRTLLAEGKASDWALAKYHMGHLNRDQDRTTQEFYKRYSEAMHFDNPDLPLYVVLSRCVNFLPSLCDIDYTQPFTEAFIRDYCEYLDFCAASKIAMLSTTSYIMYQYKDSGRKMLQGVFLPILNNRKHICGVMQKGFPADIFKMLKGLPTVGPFAATEMVQDMLHIRDNDMKWDEFPSGYYASLSLNYIKGRSLDTYIPKALFRAEVDEMVFTLKYEGGAYRMGRILHLFGRHYMTPTTSQIPYRQKRAIRDTRPSFDLYISGKNSAAGVDTYANPS